VHAHFRLSVELEKHVVGLTVPSSNLDLTRTLLYRLCMLPAIFQPVFSIYHMVFIQLTKTLRISCRGPACPASSSVPWQSSIHMFLRNFVDTLIRP
jgi:hypothetical protein